MASQLESVEREVVASEDRLAVGPHAIESRTRDSGYGSASRALRRACGGALDDPTDQDRHEVQHVIGTDSASSEIGSPDGVITAATKKMTDERVSPGAQQLLRRDDADQLEEHEQHRDR